MSPNSHYSSTGPGLGAAFKEKSNQSHNEQSTSYRNSTSYNEKTVSSSYHYASIPTIKVHSTNMSEHSIGSELDLLSPPSSSAREACGEPGTSTLTRRQIVIFLILLMLSLMASFMMVNHGPYSNDGANQLAATTADSSNSAQRYGVDSQFTTTYGSDGASDRTKEEKTMQRLTSGTVQDENEGDEGAPEREEFDSGPSSSSAFSDSTSDSEKRHAGEEKRRRWEENLIRARGARIAAKHRVMLKQV